MGKINLKRATVVITGASSGIGQATAEAFAAQGARLVLAARDLAAVDWVAGRCRQLGAAVKTVQIDVTEPKASDTLVAAAKAFGGRIDVWVSNVGVGAFGRFHETPLDAHKQVIKANLVSHMTDAHAVVPVFLKQKRGTFINIISLGGFVATPFAAAYSASKFGLRGFSEALRGELAGHHHIHVCDVYPTFIDTPGIGHAGNYSGKKLSAPPPVFDAREVAKAVIDLTQHPRDTTTVGAGVSFMRLLHGVVPGLMAASAAKGIETYLKKAKRTKVTDGNLFEPPALAGGIDGGYKRNNRSLGVVALVSVGLLLVAGIAGKRVARAAM